MGAEESKRALGAERMPVVNDTWAGAKEWGRLWQADTGEGPFQTEENELHKVKRESWKENVWEMVKRLFTLLPDKYVCLCMPWSRDAEVIMRGHKMRLLGVTGSSPDKVLEAVPWVLSLEQWESSLWIFLSKGITYWDLQCSKFPSCRACILWTGREPEWAGRWPLQAVGERDDASLDWGVGSFRR